jgi:hypothetical protein
MSPIPQEHLVQAAATVLAARIQARNDGRVDIQANQQLQAEFVAVYRMIENAIFDIGNEDALRGTR